MRLLMSKDQIIFRSIINVTLPSSERVSPGFDDIELVRNLFEEFYNTHRGSREEAMKHFILNFHKIHPEYVI